MRLNIIKIGNSKGLRLPKAILDEYQIEDKVEITLKPDYIELRPKNEPRKDWKIHFEEMAKNHEDELLIPDVFEDEEL